MTLVEIIVLALALAADAFSVGIALGISHGKARQVFRLSFHFGLFQSLMSGAGALAGALLLPHIESLDHWVIAAVLAFIGVRMAAGSFKAEEERSKGVDLTKGMYLVGMSLAVSMDALGAGVGLAVARAPLLFTVAVIGMVSALATIVAMRLSSQIGRIIGKQCELGAGIVLVALGVKVLVDHLFP